MRVEYKDINDKNHKHVFIHDDNNYTVYDLGTVQLPMVIYPHKRNRIINNFHDDPTTKANWLKELLKE